MWAGQARKNGFGVLEGAKLVPHLQWLTALKPEPLDWNGPVNIPFERLGPDWITTPICDLFDQIAVRHFEKVAVDDGASSLTYGEIQRASFVLASKIERQVPLGKPIGIMLKRSLFFLIAALACLRIGRPLIPIDHHHPKERNALIAGEAELGAVIFDDDGIGTRDVFEGLLWLDIIGALGLLPDRILKTAPADGIAFILYTSGSSGQPKGICNSQSAILHRVAQFTTACHLNAEDRFLLLGSTGSIAGLRDIFSAALNGATLVIAEPNKVGLDGILRAMDRGRITICYALPALLRSLLTLRSAQVAFRDVRILRLGGDTVRESDIALCRNTVSPSCYILIGYGSTEAPTLFQWFIPKDWSGDGSTVPCGRLMPDTSVALVNDTGASVATGEVGELIVQSQYLALGLWRRGRLECEIFEGERPLSFLRTGDLMRLRHDGLAELAGRTGRMVKILGQRVDPVEIEIVLRSNQEVKEAVVIVRKNATDDPSLDAFVVPTCLINPPRISDLRAMMSQQLPVHMRPSRFHIIEAIPLLAGFKPDIVALTNWTSAADSPLVQQAPDPDRGLVVVPALMDDHARKAVEKAWSNVLDPSSFNRNDEWAEAGGDSLKAMELIVCIEESLNVSVPPEVLDQTTTPKALIDAIRQLPRISSMWEDSLRQGSSPLSPLVFLMPGIGGDEPNLARLRMDLKNRARFVTTRYPSSSEMYAAEDRFAAIVEAVVQQIRLVAKSDDMIHLAGYSYGGFVAWEVASNLITRGYRVGAIGLIDPRRSRHLSKLDRQTSRSTIAANIVDQTRQSSSTILLWAKHWLKVCLPMRVVSILHKTERSFDTWLKERALDNLTLSKLNNPAVLFRSTDYNRISPDYGWSEFCSKLTIVLIAGTHYTMLDSPSRQSLAEQLLKAVSEAESTAAIPQGHTS